MPQSYPIWNNVEACIYKGNKSYGVRTTGSVQVYVGTSASNSHPFLTHCVTHRQHECGCRTYHFYVNGQCVTQSVLSKKGLYLSKNTVVGMSIDKEYSDCRDMVQKQDINNPHMAQFRTESHLQIRHKGGE